MSQQQSNTTVHSELGVDILQLKQAFAHAKIIHAKRLGRADLNYAQIMQLMNLPGSPTWITKIIHNKNRSTAKLHGIIQFILAAAPEYIAPSKLTSYATQHGIENNPATIRQGMNTTGLNQSAL